MTRKIRQLFRKTVKITAVFAGVVAILSLAAYFFLPAILELDKRIPGMIAKETGLECQVGEVHVILLPKPGLLLNDVVFMPPAGMANAENSAAGAPFLPLPNAGQENASLEENLESKIVSSINSTNATDNKPANSTASGNATGQNATVNAAFNPAQEVKPTSLHIRSLAIYLGIPALFSGEVEPVGLNVKGLAFYVNSLNDLNWILHQPAPQTLALEEKSGRQNIVVENSTAETIAWLWEILKSVRLSDTGIYTLNKGGLYEPLFTGLKLREFMGELSLSFTAHGQVNEKPYSMDFKIKLTEFKSGYDNASVKLEATANDEKGFTPKLETTVNFNEAKRQVQLDNFILKTGKSKLSSSIAVNFGPEGEALAWEAVGPARITDFDLPRWVPPLLKMSPETQTLLSKIEGTLDLTFRREGLFFNAIKVNTGAYHWVGEGSVTDFIGDTKVYFSLKANELPLEAVFPELSDPDRPPRFTADAPKFNQPHFLKGDTGTSPKVELILAAETLLLRSLEIKDFKAVMHNHPLDVQWEISASNISEGQVNATIFDNDDHTIDVTGDLSNVQISPILTGMGWDLPIYGSGSTNFTLKGKTGSLDDFLESMSLKCNGQAKDTLFASSSYPAKPKEREFNRFERLDFTASFDGAPVNGKSLDALIQLNAQIEGKQQKDGIKLQGKGPLEFDPDGMMEIRNFNLNGQISSNLSFMGFTGKQRNSPFKGTLKCSEKNSGFSLDISGLDFAGLTGSTHIEGKNLGDNPEFSGKAKINTQDLRQSLTGLGSDVAFVPMPLLGKADAQASFKITAAGNGTSQAQISNISAKVDQMDIFGEAWYSPGKETRIKANVSQLDIDSYWPSKDKNGPKTLAKPWNVSGWLGTNLNLTLTSPSLIFMKLPSENVTLQASTGNGKLLARLNGTTSGGPLTAELKGRDDGGLLNSTFSLRLEKASLEKITEARSGEVKASGNLEMSFDIHGRAGSMDDVPRAFDGQTAFNIGKGYFVRSQTQGPAGPKSETNTARLSKFDFMKGAAKMRAGVLYTEDLLMDGPSTHMVGHGTVDLVDQKINLTMDMNLGGVAFPVTLTGDLADPEISLRGGKFVTRNITNLGGGLIDLIGGVITLPIKIFEKGTE